MTPAEHPPIDALNAPLPPSFKERARRRKTPLLLIALGSAVLHVMFFGLVAANQSAAEKPPERLMEIDLRDAEPVKKVEKKVEKEKPQPVKIVKRVPPKQVRVLPPKKAQDTIKIKVAQRPKPVRPKAQPKIEKPPPKIKPAVAVKPPKPKPPVPTKPRVAMKPPTAKKPVPQVKPSTLVKPRTAIKPENPVKADPVPLKPREPQRQLQADAPQPEHPKPLRVGVLPRPLGNAGAAKGPGRPRSGEESAPASGNPGPKRNTLKPNARPALGSSPFDEPNANRPTTGGKGNGKEAPLPRGERTGRMAAGTALSDPTFNHSATSNRPGGGSPGSTSGSHGNGSPRSRNDDLAGIDGAGGTRSPSAMAKAGGRPRPGSNIMAYHDPTNRDPDRVAVGPGAFAPGNGGGSGAGDRRGGAGRDNGEFNRSTLNARLGSGLGGGAGGNIGGSPRRGRGGDDMAGGGGGVGGGSGGGIGGGVGRGNNGGGAGRSGPRVAGNLFGDPNGSQGGGNARGGGGKGSGPGGPGNGTRLARQDSGGGGKGGGARSGNGPNFGRGGRGPGTGAGGGIGSGDKGKGSGGSGGRGGRDDMAGEGAGGSGNGRGGRRPGIASASREREGEDIIGRGVWGSWTAQFFQDKSDHPDKPDATFGPGHGIDWPLFTDLKTTKKYQTLDFNWGDQPPVGGMKSTFWSARITGKIFVPKDDDYWFYFDQLDDAGRLVLDGKEVIKVWKVQKSTPDSGKIRLTRGEHDILIEYVQGPAVEASLTLSWKSSSFAKEVVGIYKPGGKIAG